jgi:DNA-binding NtrC family response regulator
MSKILLVENDSELRGHLRAGMVEAGHQVVESANGVEGLEQLKDHTPDLIITDIVMEEMEGLGFLLEVKKHAAMIPVIVMSGHEQYLDNSRKLGATQTLLKPFRMREVLDCIEDVTAE